MSATSVHPRAWLSARDCDPDALRALVERTPFPADLDRDPPVGGPAPPSQADVVRRALREEWTPRALRAELRAGAGRRGNRRES